jgi:methionyl-tRNA synthetase
VASIAVNLFRQLMIYLAPVMPALAKESAELVGGPIHSWEQTQTPLAGCPVAPFQPLKSRVTSEQIAAVLAASQPAEAPKKSVTATDPTGTEGTQMTDSPQPTDGQPTSTADSAEPLSAEPLAEQCTIDDFAKVDLRVARVITAEEVPEARKLLKLTVSLGGTETRTIFAGIKGYHEPASLVGRLVVVVANLAPRKMKFGLSEGMVVAASGEAAPGVYLISPENGAVPGMRLR